MTFHNIKFVGSEFANKSEIIVFHGRFKEDSTNIYLYFDKLIATQDEAVVIVREESEYKLVVSFNKTTGELLGHDVLVKLHKPNTDKELKNVPGFENERVECKAALADFMRRFLYCKNSHLFKLIANYLTEDYAWTALAVYYNNFDNIEKLCGQMKPNVVAMELIKGSLTFDENGRKLKNAIGMPVDIVNKIDVLDVAHCMGDIQECIRTKNAYIDDVRYMFDFIESFVKLTEKRKVKIDTPRVYLLVEYMIKTCLCGVNLRAIVNAVAREVLFFNNLEQMSVVNVAQYLRDTIQMLQKMGLPLDIQQNIVKWHYITSRNYRIYSHSREEEYQKVAEEINNKYSFIVDDYLIACPKTEKELLAIGHSYNNCLPKYRDEIIDNKALVLSMYPVKEGVVEYGIPPITFEVSHCLDFIQVKTFFDADVTDDSVLKTLRKWRTKVQKGVTE